MGQLCAGNRSEGGAHAHKKQPPALFSADDFFGKKGVGFVPQDGDRAQFLVSEHFQGSAFFVQADKNQNRNRKSKNKPST